ncbi:hypothetical protein SDC9_152179 [bioreactor metagenome]|uniref:Uncharacterized protein n=1 Tax=bioreactor metagenome TaxID=1076179 RepID=A0A645ESC8_9ZZZZ
MGLIMESELELSAGAAAIMGAASLAVRVLPPKPKNLLPTKTTTNINEAPRATKFKTGTQMDFLAFCGTMAAESVKFRGALFFGILLNAYLARLNSDTASLKSGSDCNRASTFATSLGEQAESRNAEINS